MGHEPGEDVGTGSAGAARNTQGRATLSGDESAGARHVPVLLSRVVELLTPALRRPVDRSPVMVDATVGLGGHAAALLAEHPRLVLVGLDRDQQALDLAERRLAAFADRIRLVHAVYDRLTDVLAELGFDRVDGVLFDLGVSSLQLDSAERGFSYARDADLDMRMDQTTGPTAADVLNTYSREELTRILREYGEERHAARIAAAIVRRRATTPFTRSGELVDLVYATVPAPARRTGGHPAKRTFQALRIEVNGELDALRRALPAAVDALAVGGRIVVLAYHSLEDRIVKRELVERATSRTPPDFPVELPEHQPELRLLTRGSEGASAEEIAQNPRAASVRLRAAERIREVAA